MNKTIFFLILSVIFIVLALGSGVAGVIRGTVTQEGNHLPLKDAIVRLTGSDKYRSVCDTTGWYELTSIPTGEYTVIARMIGYHDAARKATISSAQDSITLSFSLTPAYVELPAVVVTPGHYEVLKQQPHTLQILHREDIKSIPQLGEDFYRSLVRLPGITGEDFSARFNVRGGSYDEVLALLDGQELYEPFHLKDIGGAVSILDMEAIGSLDLITGGYPVEYGNRMSGVLDMHSYQPNPGEKRTMLGISFTNARFLTEGNFAGGKGNWLVSLRRGYLDVILKMIDSDTPANTIRYYDGFGKLSYRKNKNHTFSFDVLQAGDYTEFIGDNLPRNTAESGYGNTYLWATWNYTPSDRLMIKTIASTGRVAQERIGKEYYDFATERNPLIEDLVQDDRTFIFGGLKQQWMWKTSSNHLLRSGFDIKMERTSYNYFLSQGNWWYSKGNYITTHDTTDITLKPEGYEAAWYLSDQWHIGGPLTTDIGIRYDRYNYLHADRWSPRAGVSLTLSENTVLRSAYGSYYQAPVINSMQLQEPFSRNLRYGKFDPPAKAIHYVIGLDQGLPQRLQLRIEGYYKDLQDVFPRFESLEQELKIFPETDDDRVVFFPTGGASKGIEVFLKRPNFGKWGFWAEYVFSRVTDRIAGRDVPRTYDQRHQISCDFNFQPNRFWNLHFGWQYHTGRPQTPATFKLRFLDPSSGTIVKEYGDLFSVRLPTYSRFDVKVIRRFEFTRRTLVGFLEVVNLFGRSNVRNWWYFYRYRGGTQVDTYHKQEKWLPFLPSIGIGLEM